MNPIQSILNYLESGAKTLTQLSDLISETWKDTGSEADNQDQYISLISQILRDSEDIARSCENYLAKMDFIENKVLESSQEIEEIIEGKDRLSEKNNMTTSSIAELQTFSAQIQDMGTAVIQISKQTNLLAYNVAIESTNTDDECKGFTVLSEEIRNLAETSASSAKDITTLTRELQLNLQTVITDVQKAGDTVTVELEKVKQTILTFESINEKMKSLFHSGKKMKNLSRDGISSSRDISGQSEWLFSLQSQLNSKRMHLLNFIEKELGLHRQTIALADKLLNDDDSQSALNNDIINNCKMINDSAQEIERTIEDVFHTLNVMTTVGAHFKGGLNAVGKTVNAINTISKKDEEQIQELTTALKTDFSQVSTIVDYVQDILRANWDIIEKFNSLNSNSWNINHIIDVLINHTTMTKMLALNASLEATRTEEDAEHDYDGLVNDMRVLSEQSGTAANDIKKVMHQVEYLISKVLAGINETMYSSMHILNKVKRFIKNLQIIQRSMENSSDYLMEICIFSGMIWKNIEEANKIISKCESMQSLFSKNNVPLRDIAKSIRSQFDEITPLLYDANK
ncbi:MAG: methyl-accepting chemotaxis protein [Candidatus Auribacterota bacterium]|jgi:methyl-accepting chemotaxis protein|nr:methyl-accepting chemotaxis protein [Candidatus Auribacterota bacterium]